MSEWHRALGERLAGLNLRPEREAEIIDELSQHLDDQVRELVAGGAEPDAARAAALAELDAPGALARRLLDIERRPPLTLPPPGAPARGRFLQARWQDVRHSIRSLRRSPIFAVTVLATFALTIGPTTAILSFGNWLLWRPTPGVHQPDRLAVILVGQWTTGISMPTGVSYLNLQDLRKASKSLVGIAGLRYDSNVTVAGGSLAPAVFTAGSVTADMFDVLGVPVVAGRSFRADDDREPNGEPVILLSETLARRGFGDAGRAVNQQMVVNGLPMTVVGVLPERFAGIDPMRTVGIWYPGSTYPYVNRSLRDRPATRADGMFYTFIARLAPEATSETVKAELDVLIPALADQYPDENERFRKSLARVFPGLGPSELQRSRYATNTRVLLLIGGTLLLLGCLNVANVLMVRSVRTGRDRAIRLALGASRGRLIMLQLTESGLLAAGGAVLGLLLAIWLKQLIIALLFPEISAAVELDVPLDLRVLGWTLAVSLGCGLLAGLAPAIFGRRPALAASIAAGGRSVTKTQWLRGSLASLQLALSLALITGSLLLVATLRNLNSVDLGFNPSGVTRHVIDPGRHGYKPDRAFVYFQDVLSRLRSRAGLDAISLSGRSPFGTSYQVRIQDPQGADKPPIRAFSNAVSAGYFDVLRMKIVRGRVFTEAESLTPATATAVPVIVSENLGRRLFGDSDPVGRSFIMPKAGNSPPREMSIVGVVGDVHWNDLMERPLFLYQPLPHNPAGAGILMVRSSRSPAEVARIVEDAVREVDASLPVSFSQTIAVQIEAEASEPRMFAWVLSLVGWIAFALAAVGLYGLLAQSVTERTHEFGIRLAIGSGRRRIFALVLKQAALIGLFGIVGGLALAAFGTRMVEAQLFGITRLHVPTYLLAAGVLLVVVFVAGLWPARAATRIQPIEALRVE